MADEERAAEEVNKLLLCINILKNYRGFYLAFGTWNLSLFYEFLYSRKLQQEGLGLSKLLNSRQTDLLKKPRPPFRCVYLFFRV